MLAKYWLGALALLGLVGCSGIEYKSDQQQKVPLAEIQDSVAANPIWSVRTGNEKYAKSNSLNLDSSASSTINTVDYVRVKPDVRVQLVQDSKHLYTVDGFGLITALYKSSGDTAWEYALKAKVSAGPVLSDGKLLFATADGKVINFDIAQKRVLWKSSVTGEVLAAPEVEGGVVYVHSMDGGLSALSFKDGRQLWRYTHTLPQLILRKSSKPIVVDELVITGFSNGKAMAMNKHDGAVVWVHDVAQPRGNTDLQRMVDISADLVVSGNVLYVATFQNNLVALSKDTGHLIWEREIPSLSGYTLSANMLFVSAANGEVVALDKNDGNTYWLQNELKGRRLTKPALMEKWLVVADEDGYVHWIDQESGKLVGRFKFGQGGVEATPVVSGNVVYLLGRSGKVVALEVG